jgi:hypothetical protein
MKKKFFLVLASVSIALIMSSCGKIPQAEIDAANAAVADAKAGGAETYIPEEFTALQDSLRIALENVEVQKSKLFRKYSGPKKQLIGVAALAATVKQNTETKKTAVKAEIQTTLTDIATLQDENKKLLTKAPKGKEGKAALEAIKNDITGIETSVTEANTMVTSGDFMAALYKVKAAKEKATEINNELKSAIEKSKGKPKAKGKK